MLYSMTGYGEAAFENEQLRVGFRVKTLNNRGLDFSLKLPFDFMYLESSLREILKGHCFRGRVDVFTEIEIRDPELKPPTPLNRARMGQLVELCREVKESFPVRGELDINQVITIPDLTLTQRVGYRLPDELEAKILETFNLALVKLSESRRAEGSKLGEDLVKRLQQLRGEADRLEEISKQRHQDLKAQILQRIQALIEDTDIDEIRLSQEVVYYADRLDISEEITRLEAHMDTTLELLESDKRPVGKQLDFLIQEQLREVTTIGNKAKNKWIADKVVLLKTGYEKMREQIQNIE